MPSHRDIRDPIHGFIRIEGRECDIVDAPVFQRLRHVRQLAMAYLVYPSATHSRFEHTLGVLHVAGRMCDRLDVDAPHTQTIRFAALLHDIGHGPFSHPSESVLAELAPPDIKANAGGLDKIHELITRQIILTDPDLRRLVSEHEREQIVQLLDDGLDQPLYKQIVSGPLDADKQDYLLRDSYSPAFATASSTSSGFMLCSVGRTDQKDRTWSSTPTGCTRWNSSCSHAIF